jgi:hypothetical protein
MVSEAPRDGMSVVTFDIPSDSVPWALTQADRDTEQLDEAFFACWRYVKSSLHHLRLDTNIYS